jgi:hypothetical protein
MDLEVTYADDVPWEDWDRRLLERAARRLGAVARRYGGGRLYVNVSTFGDGDYRAEAYLTVGGENLHVDHVAAAMPELVRGVVDGLRRELHRYRLRVNPALRARHAARQRRMERRPDAPGLGYAFRKVPETLRGDVVERVLPALQRVATHEIAIRQSQDEIEPGFIDPIEVVDDVLREELEQEEVLRSLPDLAAHLESRVIEKIAALASDFEASRDTDVQLDTDIPEWDESLEVTDLGRNLLDFWVMDEDLMLEDLFPDPTSVDPETVVREREGQDILMQGLFRLPDEMRRIFAAVVIDGWLPTEVAGARGMSDRDVEGVIDEAAHRLARTLTGAPAYSAERVLELYTALGVQLHRNALRVIEGEGEG